MAGATGWRRLRRILWISLAVALILAAAGVYVFVLKPRAILDRAERTLFRRSSVTFVSPEQGDRFFFVSNRESDPGLTPLENGINPVRSPHLSYGEYVSRLDPGLTVERILDVAAWFDSIGVLEANSLTEADFLSDLRAMVDASPLRSVLIIVQGLHTELPRSMRHSAFMARALDIDTPMVVFDWPGNQGRGLRDYRRAVGLAGESGRDLAGFLALVTAEVRPDRIWVMSNSLGGEVIVRAIEALYEREDFADAEPELDAVVLVAPDGDHAGFFDSTKAQLAAVTRSATVYVSSNDQALAISRFVNLGRRRVGQSTLRLDSATRVADPPDLDEELVAFVDVTPVNRTNNFHDFGFEAPEFYDDLFLRLTNADVPASRRLYPVRAADGRLYWVLSRR